MPSFAHVSLILAPDRSKLSKRHGATSVGQVQQLPLIFSADVDFGKFIKHAKDANDFIIILYGSSGRWVIYLRPW